MGLGDGETADWRALVAEAEAGNSWLSGGFLAKRLRKGMVNSASGGVQKKLHRYRPLGKLSTAEKDTPSICALVAIAPILPDAYLSFKHSLQIIPDCI